MSTPLTDYERTVQRQNAEYILGHSTAADDRIPPLNIARMILSYEGTLQTKDERIEALVTALEEIRDVAGMSPPMARLMEARTIAKAAIKEATHG